MKRSRAGCIRIYGKFLVPKGVETENRKRDGRGSKLRKLRPKYLALLCDLAVPETMSRSDQAALQAAQQAKFNEYVER
jgi:hypothetical protein